MQPTKEQLIQGLRKAHEAGDIAAVNELANYLDANFPEDKPAQPAQPAQTPQPVSAPVKEQSWDFMGDMRKLAGYGEEAAQGVSDAVQSNAAIAGGVGGAVTGTMLGGPVGGVIGGMIGTFGGEVYEDVYADLPPDYSNALNSAVTSGLIDVATLGTGKVMKALYQGFKAGKAPAEVVAEIAAKSKQAPKAGGEASIAQTQTTLNRYGETLTPAEVGSNSGIANFIDGLSRDTLGGAPIMNARKERLELVVNSELDKLFNGSVGSQMTSEEIGQAVNTVITQGKQALGATYAKTLDDVGAKLAGKSVETGAVVNKMSSFINSFKRTYGSELDDSTLAFIKDRMEELSKLSSRGTDALLLKKQTPAMDLISFEQKMNRMIDTLGDFNNPNYNPVASYQLAQFSKEFRDSVSSQLIGVDKTAGALYKNAKDLYAEGIGNILPELNKNAVQQAGKKGNFKPLGTLLTEANNLESVKKAIVSVKAAYAQMPKEVADGLSVKTADEAVEMIRDGYVTGLLKTQGDEIIQPEHFARIARQLDDPKKLQRAEVVLGKDKAVALKRFLNLAHDVSKKPQSPAGSLVIRGLEAAAGFGIFDASGSGLVTAAAVFGLPNVAARVSTNPKLVNKLLAATNNPKFNTADKLAIAINDLLVNYGMFEEVVEATALQTAEAEQAEAMGNRFP